jgi:type VI secretion system protein ImpA
MGLPGLAAGLAVIKGYVADFWPSVHPQLDPEDDNDPGARVNALVSLCDPVAVLPAVRALPLTQSRQLGRITYRDYAIATGLLPPPPPKKGQEKDKPKYPDSATIEAAFADTPIETLQEFQAAAAGAFEALAGIDSALSGVLGSASGPDLDPLRKLVREIKGLLDQQMAKRGGVVEAGPTEGEGEIAQMGAGPGSAPALGGGTGGVIRGRNDVVLLLEKICRYYSDHEPSSPVPLLLERAKRLVVMNFMDIIKDLTPDSVNNVSAIAGIKEEPQQ